MADTEQSGVEIGALIDNRKLSWFQIRVAILCGFVVLMDGYDIQTMSLAVPSLAAQWGLAKSSFGPALSAALIGMGLGAALIAPLGDRFGRRSVLLVSLGIVGLMSLGTAYVTSIEQLLAMRLLTGIGLGASLPNATALTTEYAPKRSRAAMITLMYANVAIGAFVAGFTAPAIIAYSGWQGIFVVGGVIPLGLMLVLYFRLPESIRFLLLRRPGNPRIATVLAELAPGVAAQSVHTAPENLAVKGSVLSLLSPAYRARTILLWLIFVLNLFTLYVLISWLPTILGDAGWTPANALRGSVLIQAGGVAGGLMLAYFVDRRKTVPAMLAAYGVTAILLGLFMIVPSNIIAWGLLLLGIGGGTAGAQFALNALAASFYPSAIRATGVGWAFAMGRIGAIIAPLVGGWIVALGVAPVHILALLAVPAMAAAVCVFLLSLVWKPD